MITLIASRVREDYYLLHTPCFEVFTPSYGLVYFVRQKYRILFFSYFHKKSHLWPCSLVNNSTINSLIRVIFDSIRSKLSDKHDRIKKIGITLSCSKVMLILVPGVELLSSMSRTPVPVELFIYKKRYIYHPKHCMV